MMMKEELGMLLNEITRLTTHFGEFRISYLYSNDEGYRIDQYTLLSKKEIANCKSYDDLEEFLGAVKMWVGEFNYKDYGSEQEAYEKALKDFLSGRSDEGEVDELEVCDISPEGFFEDLLKSIDTESDFIYKIAY